MFACMKERRERQKERERFIVKLYDTATSMLKQVRVPTATELIPLEGCLAVPLATVEDSFKILWFTTKSLNGLVPP